VDAHQMLAQLEAVRENVRKAIQNSNEGETPRKEQHYG
jgi:MarR family transcriptional regulator, transcriptional regulator for hemolysin